MNQTIASIESGHASAHAASTYSNIISSPSPAASERMTHLVDG